jgi:hypothetical protein
VVVVVLLPVLLLLLSLLPVLLLLLLTPAPCGLQHPLVWPHPSAPAPLPSLVLSCIGGRQPSPAFVRSRTICTSQTCHFLTLS